MDDFNFDMIEQLPYDIIPGFIDKGTVNQETQKLVDQLIEKYEQGMFSIILYKLTHLKYSPSKARELWEVILGHKERLSKFLRRDVGIYVAAMDYFVNFGERPIRTPIIIDKDYLQELRKNIFIDETTGLYNSFYYEKKIKEQVAESKRSQSPFSLLIVRVHDTGNGQGTLFGIARNNILREAGELIRDTIRSSDTAMHMGSGEFIILLTTTLKKEALFFGEKLRKKLQNIFSRRKISVEMGAASFPENTQKDGNLLYAMAKSCLENLKRAEMLRSNRDPGEKRKHKRLLLKEDSNLIVDFLHPKELNRKLDRIRDISKKGMGFQVQDMALNISDPVLGCIRRGDHEIRFKGQVVWTRQVQDNSYAVGVQFLSV